MDRSQWTQSDPFGTPEDLQNVETHLRRAASRRAILDFDLEPQPGANGIVYIDRGYHGAVLPLLIAFVPVCIVVGMMPILVSVATSSLRFDAVDLILVMGMGIAILSITFLLRWGLRRSRGSRQLHIDRDFQFISIEQDGEPTAATARIPIDECRVGSHTVLFAGKMGYATALTVRGQVFLLSIHFRKSAAGAYLAKLPPALSSRLRTGPVLLLRGSPFLA